jgi:hypothetical protein
VFIKRLERVSDAEDDLGDHARVARRDAFAKRFSKKITSNPARRPRPASQ